ncbi:Zinc finger, RING-type [Sesbania bispinosa]|nr:Zinc finger, RING-type [Sesbania bispinosa]
MAFYAGNHDIRVTKIESTDQQQSQSLQNAKPTAIDFFKIELTAIIDSIYLDSPPKVIEVGCKDFFEDNDDLLRFLVSDDSPLIPYVTYEELDELTQRIISQVQQLFDINGEDLSESAKPTDVEPRIFSLAVEIIIDVGSDEENNLENDLAVIEESIQSVQMIPASMNAVQSLKIYTLPYRCNICMEKFYDHDTDEDEVVISPMPCDHVFHHSCIVHWLQTNHVCPLCRYPMPITDN